MPPDDALVRLRGVSKDYRSLRPLRIAELDLPPGRSLALLGFDQMMAEVFVDLITGAILPDSGEVIVFGQPTSSIADPGAWLTTLDQFGLLTDRAVLVEQFTVEQNLALPLSVAVESMSPDVRARVAELATEVGLGQRSRATSGCARHRRAGAHPSRSRAGARAEGARRRASRTRRSRRRTHRRFAADMSRIVAARGIASLVLTADQAFARAVAREVLVLEPGDRRTQARVCLAPLVFVTWERTWKGRET